MNSFIKTVVKGSAWLNDNERNSTFGQLSRTALITDLASIAVTLSPPKLDRGRFLRLGTTINSPICSFFKFFPVPFKNVFRSLNIDTSVSMYWHESTRSIQDLSCLNPIPEGINLIQQTHMAKSSRLTKRQ